MRTISITSCDPIYPKVLALLSEDCGACDSAPQMETKSESCDPFDSMDRDALKKAIRDAGIMSQIRNKYSDDDLRDMLRKNDTSSDDEEDDDEEEEELFDAPKSSKAKKQEEEEEEDEPDEEEEDEPDEEDDEEEVELEIGMSIKARVGGKLQKAKVVAIDEARGRVKVKTAEGKTVTIKPEAIEA